MRDELITIEKDIKVEILPMVKVRESPPGFIVAVLDFL